MFGLQTKTAIPPNDEEEPVRNMHEVRFFVVHTQHCLMALGLETNWSLVQKPEWRCKIGFYLICFKRTWKSAAKKSCEACHFTYPKFSGSIDPVFFWEVWMRILEVVHRAKQTLVCYCRCLLGLAGERLKRPLGSFCQHLQFCWGKLEHGGQLVSTNHNFVTHQSVSSPTWNTSRSRPIDPFCTLWFSANCKLVFETPRHLRHLAQAVEIPFCDHALSCQKRDATTEERLFSETHRRSAQLQ